MRSKTASRRVRLEAEARRLYTVDRASQLAGGRRVPAWVAADPALRETYRAQAAYLLQVAEGDWRDATRY